MLKLKNTCEIITCEKLVKSVIPQLRKYNTDWCVGTIMKQIGVTQILRYSNPKLIILDTPVIKHKRRRTNNVQRRRRGQRRLSK